MEGKFPREWQGRRGGVRQPSLRQLVDTTDAMISVQSVQSIPLRSGMLSAPILSEK